MKKIAILQSNYLPWKGVFDLMHQVDTFVFLEDVQYTERDWRNRNKLLTANGTCWITVPVRNSSRRGQLINEAEIDNSVNWQKVHYKTLQANYARAPYFKQYKWLLDELYMSRQWIRLTDLNQYSAQLIASVLGIKAGFVDSTSLNSVGIKDDKLLDICQKVGGTYYLSGPAAKNYIDPDKFDSCKITLDYITYEYPEYRQLHSPFNHFVTVLDLIFNCGPDAPYYIWGWRETSPSGSSQEVLRDEFAV